MNPTIAFFVEGHPVGKQRARGTRHGRHYTPKKTVDYETAIHIAFYRAQVKWEKKSGVPWPMDGACKLTVFIYAESYTRPDVSNVVKAVEDALNKVAYHDDRQLELVTGEQHEPSIKHPGVFVVVEQHRTQADVDAERKRVRKAKASAKKAKKAAKKAMKAMMLK